MKPVIIGDAEPLSAIYQILNTVNGKRYIGSAVNYPQRWRQHKSLLSQGCHTPKLQASWNKYGADSFAFSVVELVPDKASLIAREQFWIDSLNVVVSGLNCCPTAGSLLGMRHTDATKAKLVAKRALRPSKPCSEETKQKISAAQAGKKKPPLSDDHRAALSRTSKGRMMPPRTDEYRAMVSAIRTGAKATNETKEKMSASQRARWAIRNEVKNVV